MQDHPKEGGSWSQVAIHVVQLGINLRPSRVKGNHPPYDAFFGMKARVHSARDILDDRLIAMCTTEDGLNAARDIVLNSESHPTDEEIEIAIRNADCRFFTNDEDNDATNIDTSSTALALPVENEAGLAMDETEEKEQLDATFCQALTKVGVQFPLHDAPDLSELSHISVSHTITGCTK